MQTQSIRPMRYTDSLRQKKTRFLLYCHDTFGLGHLRRALSMAMHFTTSMPDAEVLIATGSPLAHSFALPPRTDYIKLPAVLKLSNGSYRARHLDMEFETIRDLRATLLLETARSYRPDVFLVDHAPQGLKGEVLATLALLRDSQPQCLRVLGLRDIIDAGGSTRQTWIRDGIYDTLEYDYDLILVYGSQKLYDIGAEYALPESVDRRVRYCGYLDRLTEATQASTVAPTHYATRDHLIVVTAGGGGDGFSLMQSYLFGLKKLATIPFTSVLLTGPMIAADEKRELDELGATLPADKVRIEMFLTNPLPLLRAADLVVSMAGYNTTCELLGLRQRILLIPRAVPREEQLIRASLLAKHGLVQMLHPSQLTPEKIIESVQHSLRRPRPLPEQFAAAGITFDGQTLARQAILEGLATLQVRPRFADPRLVYHRGFLKEPSRYENSLSLR